MDLQHRFAANQFTTVERAASFSHLQVAFDPHHEIAGSEVSAQIKTECNIATNFVSASIPEQFQSKQLEKGVKQPKGLNSMKVVDKTA